MSFDTKTMTDFVNSHLIFFFILSFPLHRWVQHPTKYQINQREFASVYSLNFQQKYIRLRDTPVKFVRIRVWLWLESFHFRMLNQHIWVYLLRIFFILLSSFLSLAPVVCVLFHFIRCYSFRFVVEYTFTRTTHYPIIKVLKIIFFLLFRFVLFSLLFLFAYTCMRKEKRSAE